MDIITVLSYAIFIATVVTIVMAAISYAAFKIRDWRKPDRTPGATIGAAGLEEDTLFFRKYQPPPEESLDRETGP